MDIRNRMADVERLRRNACQDYLKMIVVPGWQQKLYERAGKGISDRKTSDKFRPIYQKMRDKGIDNFQVNDLDITAMLFLLLECKDICPAASKVIREMKQLADDRNEASHSGGNESPEDLYLRGYIYLCNLEKFVNTVDLYEKSIDDEVRLLYRQKYVMKIKELEQLIDGERLESAQPDKIKELNMDLQIDEILNSDNQDMKYWDILSKYMRYDADNHSPNHLWLKFGMKAFDAGINAAFGVAISYFSFYKDFAEAERRMVKFYSSCDHIEESDANTIIMCINQYLSAGKPLTEGMNTLIEGLKKQGYDVVRVRVTNTRPEARAEHGDENNTQDQNSRYEYKIIDHSPRKSTWSNGSEEYMGAAAQYDQSASHGNRKNHK